MAENKNAGRATLRGAKIPQIPLDQALKVASALHELAGPVSKAILAQHMKSSTTSGPFKTKLASSIYYGLVKVDAGLYSVTSRGDAILGNDEKARAAARREAVMSTNFGQIIKTLATRNADESVIALKLQQELDAPQTSAPRIAKVLIESARQGELLTDGDRFDAAAIESAASVIPSADRNGRGSVEKSETVRQAERSAPEKKPAAQPMRTDAAPRKKVVEHPLAPVVHVEIKIDATHLKPQEIAELVRALRTSEVESAS